jgi:hypothetical protein
MPERPDLRKIAADIREALETYPREALADILTYVFQAYVVEGTPTVAATQPERMVELEGLSFAEVIAALQTRLDLPELALFDVSAGRVSLRVGGQMIPIVADRSRDTLSPTVSSPPVAAQTSDLRPQTSGSGSESPRPEARGPRPETRPDGGPPRVSVEEVPSNQLRPPPPPRRGLSISSNPGSGAQPPTQQPAAAAQQPAQRPAQPGAPQQGQAGQSDKPAGGDDAEGSKRFSLLDID